MRLERVLVAAAGIVLLWSGCGSDEVVATRDVIRDRVREIGAERGIPELERFGLMESQVDRVVDVHCGIDLERRIALAQGGASLNNITVEHQVEITEVIVEVACPDELDEVEQLRETLGIGGVAQWSPDTYLPIASATAAVSRHRTTPRSSS